jgi:spore coat protein E
MMANTDRDLQFREIVCKAVCGKGRKFSQDAHQLTPPDAISTILGAWIINHTYEATKAGDVVEITGSYDINIWYSHQNNTKTDVAKQTVSYIDQVPLSYFDRNVREGSVEVSALATQQPNCIEATISEGSNVVIVRVEREFLVEVMGETKLTVAVTDSGMFADKELELEELAEQESGDYEDLDPDLVIDDLDS